MIEHGNNTKSNKAEHLCHQLQFYSERFPDFTEHNFTAPVYGIYFYFYFLCICDMSLEYKEGLWCDF